MSGTPQQPNPQQPYGTQGQAQPQWQPPVAKAPKGSVSTKVWGIVLMVFGAMGLIGVIAMIVSLGGGMTGAAFSPGMSPEAKAEMDRFAQQMTENMATRWSFWASAVLETAVMVLSLVGGFLLAIRPRPLGRKMAIWRVLLVFLLLPITGYEQTQQLDETLKMQDRIIQIQVEDSIDKQYSGDPAENEAERERRRKQAEAGVEQMKPFMKGFGYGAIIFTILFPLIVNAVLLFFMTRPSVKEYLESVAAEGDNAIPGYDPSMGMIGPPPGAAPPQQPPTVGPDAPTEQPPKAD